MYEAEGYFIAKYKPKYNYKITGYFRLIIARDKIREATGIEYFTVLDLRKKCEKLDIDICSLNGLSYINRNDVDRIICDLKRGE